MVLKVVPELSPRLFTVPITDGVSISMQELLDQLRGWEDEPPNMSYPRTILASGKDDLGGGVTVGITTQLQNGQVEFEERTTPVSSGTATGADATGTVLTDGTATFEADGVLRGAWIINFTDQSVSTVLTVDDENNITHKTLIEGSGNDWGIGDAYKIWNIIQVEMDGGNATAIDSVGATISPVYTSFGNQVVRTSSSSATLQELQDIQFASFNGGVTIDIANKTGNAAAGTEFPAGTGRQPCDNVADALSIASTNGFFKLFILGDVTFDTPSDLTDFTILGENKNTSTFTLNTGTVLDNVHLIDATITGVLDGASTVGSCLLDTLTVISGLVHNSWLLNTVTLGGAATADFINCSSGVPGAGTPTLNMGGSGNDMSFRNYSGGLLVTNLTAEQNVSLDIMPGAITLDATVTAGTFYVRGVGTLTDNSTATLVNTDGLADTTVWEHVIEPGFTAEEMLRLVASSAAGKLAGADTTNVTIRDLGDTKDRITATVDANGNRTAVTHDTA